MSEDLNLKFCLGCGIMLKQWKPGDDDFCGAREQCIPLWELREANARIALLEDEVDRLRSIITKVQKAHEARHGHYTNDGAVKHVEWLWGKAFDELISFDVNDISSKKVDSNERV